MSPCCRHTKLPSVCINWLCPSMSSVCVPPPSSSRLVASALYSWQCPIVPQCSSVGLLSDSAPECGGRCWQVLLGCRHHKLPSVCTNWLCPSMSQYVCPPLPGLYQCSLYVQLTEPQCAPVCVPPVWLVVSSHLTVPQWAPMCSSPWWRLSHLTVARLPKNA